MNALTLALPLALALSACRGGSDTDTHPIDADGDGVTADLDCNDDDASVFPGAPELCNGVDDDCDGVIDGDAIDASTFYADADGDGYGDPAAAVSGCDAPDGYVADGSDCDDSDAAYHPGAIEDDCADPNDYNCDGSVGYADADGDGYPACDDCDDDDAAVNPGATEVCNGVDDDCSGEIDDDATDALTFYADADGDDHGDPSATVSACEAPQGYVSSSDDCDDDAAAVNPSATEVCNGVDDDCDGTIDLDAADATTWYADADGDGHGDPDVTRQACAAPEGFVSSSSDCDDTRDDVYAGAPEACDDVDRDCDGATRDPDAVDATTWYVDADGDGYGLTSTGEVACDAPSGHVARGGDCDDTSAAVNPGATEVCNGIDDDCSGAIDDDAADATTWYTDADGDGFGDPTTAEAACAQPTGAVADATDCDDGDDTIHPGADEACDGIDRDCDGDVENGVSGSAEACAALSCLDILDAQPGASDGVYWLAPESGVTLQTWCDMSDGGWTLAFLKNSVDNLPIFTGTRQYGADYHADDLLAGDPADASLLTATTPIQAWLDLNTFTYDHLRLSAWRNGEHRYTSDDIARTELRIEFGQNGYLLYNAPADPPRGDAQGYYWCGGDRNFTDHGAGQVNRPAGAPADCKAHGSLGAGWDFSRSPSTNQGLTLCGADGASLWMHSGYGETWYTYPAPGASQAIWAR